MIVLDANILIPAVLGKKVRSLLVRYAERIEFVAPDSAFEEAARHLPRLLSQRGVAPEPFMQYFYSLDGSVAIVEAEQYSGFELIARQRIARRDENDWPVLATALARKCPIWTEDKDFFGCGVATWTTDRVELYLEQAGAPEN